MKKRRYYRRILKDGLFSDIDDMSIEDIYHLKKYIKRKQRLEKSYIRFMLSVLVLYIISAILSLLSQVFVWDDVGATSSMFLFITSMVILISLFFRNVYNVDVMFGSQTLEMNINYLNPDKKEQLKNYEKIADRKKNIDSILNS